MPEDSVTSWKDAGHPPISAPVCLTLTHLHPRPPLTQTLLQTANTLRRLLAAILVVFRAQTLLITFPGLVVSCKI